MQLQKIKIALADDQTLFRKGLISLIDMVGLEYDLLFEADNGIDLQRKINAANPPEILLLDVNMPEMDGYEVVSWLKKNIPSVKVLVVSMIQ